MNQMNEALQRVQSVADYQFGKGIGKKLFPESVEIQFSRATGRIRYINLDFKRLATLRPTDGLLSLSIDAVRLMIEKGFNNNLVTVRSDVAQFIADGGDVFATHVVKVSGNVHAKEEVIVVNEEGRLLAVGRAALSAPEMRAFKTGVAVTVRHGFSEKLQKEPALK
jgi:uncharacterized protein with predicted RNA binding PUA domain